MGMIIVLLILFLKNDFAYSNPEACCRTTPDSPGLLYDCSSCGLEMIPEDIHVDAKRLVLKGNRLTEVGSGHFRHLTVLQELDLSMNSIEKYDADAFIGLGALKKLNIKNRAPSFPALPEGLFAPLVQLQSLTLCEYPLPNSKFPQRVWISSLNPELKSLTLCVPENYVFTEGFTRLKSLETLIINGGFCSLGIITRETFNVFSNSTIKTLEVTHSALYDISSDSLSMFHSLEMLNLACNEYLKFDKIFDAVKSLPSRSLHTLVVDTCGRKQNRNRVMNELTPSLFDSPVFTNLCRISLRGNNIVSFDANVFRKIPRVEHINFGFNTVFRTLPGDSLFTNISMTLLNKMNVTAIDLSFYGSKWFHIQVLREKYCRNLATTEDFFRQPPPYISKPSMIRTTSRAMDYSTGKDLLMINVPQSLLYLYVDHGFSGHDHLNLDKYSLSQNNVLYLDYSGNTIRSLSGSSVNLKNLQGLDFTLCGIVSITPEFMKSLSGLVVLKLSKNSFTSNGLKFLSGTGNGSSLKFIDLSYNLLATLEDKHIIRLSSLEVLNLTGNHISTINAGFIGNPNLKTLDISDCSLRSLSIHCTVGLESLHTQSSVALRVYLRGNPFSGNCETLEFLQWIKSTDVNIVEKDSLTCEFDNTTINIKNMDIEALRLSCSSYVLPLATVISVPSFLIVSNILIISLSYYYRWSLKWRFYLIRRRFRMLIRGTERDDQLLHGAIGYQMYDAFVSYCHTDDYEWVQDTLLPKLEEEWGFRLCIGQRDFIPGVPIAENVCEAIDNSRFTIFVLTPPFLESGWCDFELNMALTRGYKHLILLHKDEVDMKQTSKTLRTLMKSITYIEYSDSEDGQAMFWQKRNDALANRTQNRETVL